MADKHLSVAYLQNYIRSKDHHPEQISGYFLKLTEEVGELSRAIRKNLRPVGEGQIKETIEEELWDVLYYTLAIANCYGIELEKVIPLKESLNQQKYPSGVRLDPAEEENGGDDVQTETGMERGGYLG